MQIPFVPFISQRGVDAPQPNDCGHACTVGLIHAYTPNRPTVKEASIRAQIFNGQPTSPTPLIKMAALYGLKLVAQPNADVRWYISEIEQGRPAMALVNYFPIGGEHFSHWVNVIGHETDGTFIIHDPYPVKGGDFKRLTKNQFIEAIETIMPNYNWRRMGIGIAPDMGGGGPVAPGRGMFSYNVNGTQLVEQGRDNDFLNHLRLLRPATVLIMDDMHRNDPVKAMGFSLRVKQATGAEVIHRQYDPDELWAFESADSWFIRHRVFGDAGLTLYAYNEPQGDMHALAAKLLRIAELCVQHNIKVVLGNFSVGMPNEHSWHIFAPLLRFIAKYPHLLRLGVHEYAPHLLTAEFTHTVGHFPTVAPLAMPYLLGRYRWLREFQRKNNIGRVPIVVTEFGWDTIHDPVHFNWQRNLHGYTDRAGFWIAKKWWESVGAHVAYFARQQIEWAVNQLYRPDPDVLGVCFFCYGGRGVWHTNFDVQSYEPLKRELEKVNWQRMSDSPAAPSKGNTFSIYGLGKDALMVRAEPKRTATNVVGRLTNGSPVEDFLPETVVAEGYRWRAIMYQGVKRWIAVDGTGAGGNVTGVYFKA